ncbi:MAG: excalibur calcium-binding domain-containing protein [Candidatus Levybacteria bacterium]|nr:excalibur calcium-binding domain-containing protein [Candidatus Levybacteria bacterium]
MSDSEEKKEKDTQDKSDRKGPSTFTKLRTNRKFRLIFIGILLVIVAILFYFFEKLRIVLAIAFITLLAAFGLEVGQNDWDLGKLWETKSFEQSKVSRDTQGNILFDKMGNITTDGETGKKADDYNCSDFTSNPEAQSFFVKVGGSGNDLNRLDGDKDGEACESLPKNQR